MEVRRIRWLGVPTHNYGEMVGFLRDVLRLRLNFDEGTTAEFSTLDDDRVQVMAPGDPYFAFFAEQARGLVPLFEVDDVRAARREFEDAGVEVIGVGRLRAGRRGHVCDMAFEHQWLVPRAGVSDTPARLTDDDVRRKLGWLPHWSGDERGLTRIINEPTEDLRLHLRRVLDLSPHGGDLRQDADCLIITLRTESAEGVTAYDIALAQRIDDVLIDAVPAPMAGTR
jgi:hypothetical protein